MVRDAKEHEAEDKKIKEAVESRNKLDGMIISVEKTLSENQDKIPAEEAQNLKEALEQAKQDLKSKEGDAEGLKAAYDNLMTKAQKVAELLYKQNQGSTNPDESKDNNSNDNGPIDADIS